MQREPEGTAGGRILVPSPRLRPPLPLTPTRSSPRPYWVCLRSVLQRQRTEDSAHAGAGVSMCACVCAPASAGVNVCVPDCESPWLGVRWS